MPVALQVIGYAFEDEKVLGIMKVLAESLVHWNEEAIKDFRGTLGTVGTKKTD